MNMLKFLPGSQRIVLEELAEMLKAGERVSIRRIAARTPYTERTVINALRGLRACGIVSMHQERVGCAADYRVVVEEC